MNHNGFLYLRRRYEIFINYIAKLYTFNTKYKLISTNHHLQVTVIKFKNYLQKQVFKLLTKIISKNNRIGDDLPSPYPLK